MKSFTSLSLAFLMILVLGACTTAHVTKAVMTTGLDDQGRNVDTTVAYKPDAPKFIVVADIANAPEDTKITVKWIYVPQNREIDKVEMVLPGSRSINSSLTRGENLWPEGDYEVQIFIDQKKEQSHKVAFKVVQ
jgi:hypothetical protein